MYENGKRIIAPTETVTLFVDFRHIGANIGTARLAFHNLLIGKVMSIDKNYNILNFDQWCDTNTAEYWSDQPHLRTRCSGETVYWPIPTTALVLRRLDFSSNKRRRKKRGRFEMIKFFGNRCQNCYKTFPDSDLTIEHVEPKSRGGLNNAANFLITCARCNKKKGDTTPWVDDKGRLMKAKPIPDQWFYISPKYYRDEWKNNLVFDKRKSVIRT